LWIACVTLLLALPGAAAHAGAVKTEHVTAELVASASAVQPGQTVQVGLLLQHIPHWHTYWRNPGDSGLPTTLSWTLPDGSRIGDIQWPAPKRLPIGPLVNYGYEDELLLPMAFTAPADARPGSELLLKARADWLVCKDVCIPENATLELRLPVVAAGVTPGSTAATALFERALAEQAVPLDVANAGWSAALQQSGRDLLLTLESSDKAPSAVPAVHVFPFVEQLIDPAVHQLYRTPHGYAVKLLLMPDAQPPAELKGIAVAQGDNTQPWGGTRRMVEFSAPWQVVVKLALPDGAVRMDAAAAPRATGVASMAGTSITVWSALLMAFIGGMVLNLMPCVFPVLSIKLLSLTQQAQPPTALRAQALAYGGGVLGSFLVLAAALIALQAAGSAIGWGFQLQEPGVVFVLAVLFFAIGLNLIGAFDFSQVVPQRLAQWRAKRPAGDAFACGVLAVVAASPCTAPFMGAALGYAMTQSPAMALGVFAALGLGMAVPFMLLTVMPGWRKRLPKPGAWMLHLKQGLAFPMFATAVWLLWVLGQQAGVSAMARLLMAVVGLGLVLWLTHVRLARGVVGRIGALAAMLALLVWSWPAALPADTPSPAAGSAADAGEGVWQPYDRQALDRLVAAGQPVFVDFTAAWCVSCQVNKRLVLNVKETQAAFDESKVVLMRADWTRRDAAITEALAALGRNGVPVYALYRPGRDTLLLPEVLTFGTVREALATLQP
jgi:thiol:disulfide interchange protein/DsbC/DsbD-like thiol-disulfide interchange protein